MPIENSLEKDDVTKAQNETVYSSKEGLVTSTSPVQTVESANIQPTSVVNNTNSETPEFRPNSNSPINTIDRKDLIKGYNFWVKFSAIYTFIGAGFLILIGIPLLLALGLGLIYIGIGVFNIFLGLKLWNSGEKIGKMDENTNQSEFNSRVFAGLREMKLYYQITGILICISLALGLLGAIFFGAAIVGGIGSYRSEFDRFDRDYPALNGGNSYSKSSYSSSTPSLFQDDEIGQ